MLGVVNRPRLGRPTTVRRVFDARRHLNGICIFTLMTAVCRLRCAGAALTLCALLALNSCATGSSKSSSEFSENDLGQPCAEEGATEGFENGTAVCRTGVDGALTWENLALVGQQETIAGSDADPRKESSTDLDESDTPVSWSWDDSSESYVSTGTPPECPSTLIATNALLDFSQVRAKLVPGQVRDDEYLVNSSFGWMGKGQPLPSEVRITVPFDGYVTGVWQFLKDGSYLFGLNLVHPCGLMLRLSKMADPSGEVKDELLYPLGEAKERASQETFLKPGVWLTRGTLLASGVSKFWQLDVTILDLRTRNPQVPADFDFKKWESSAAPQYVWYARCTYQQPYFSDEEIDLIRNLPLINDDPKSDLCE
jgi:hypothetical protein